MSTWIGDMNMVFMSSWIYNTDMVFIPYLGAAAISCVSHRLEVPIMSYSTEMISRQIQNKLCSK